MLPDQVRGGDPVLASSQANFRFVASHRALRQVILLSRQRAEGHVKNMPGFGQQKEGCQKMPKCEASARNKKRQASMAKFHAARASDAALRTSSRPGSLIPGSR